MNFFAPKRSSPVDMQWSTTSPSSRIVKASTTPKGGGASARTLVLQRLPLLSLTPWPRLSSLFQTGVLTGVGGQRRGDWWLGVPCASFRA